MASGIDITTAEDTSADMFEDDGTSHSPSTVVSDGVPYTATCHLSLNGVSNDISVTKCPSPSTVIPKDESSTAMCHSLPAVVPDNITSTAPFHSPITFVPDDIPSTATCHSSSNVVNDNSVFQSGSSQHISIQKNPLMERAWLKSCLKQDHLSNTSQAQSQPVWKNGSKDVTKHEGLAGASYVTQSDILDRFKRSPQDNTHVDISITSKLHPAHEINSKNISEKPQDIFVGSPQPGCSLSPDYGGYVCPFCEVNSDNLNLLELHMAAAHSEQLDGGDVDMLEGRETGISGEESFFEFVCPLCDLDLGDQVTLELHLLNMHEEAGESSGPAQACWLCGYTSTSESLLKQHIESHDTGQVFYGVSEDSPGCSDWGSPTVMKCPVCGYEMTDADLLTSHVESHFNQHHSPGQPSTIFPLNHHSSSNGNVENTNKWETQQNESISKNNSVNKSTSIGSRSGSIQNKSPPRSRHESISYKQQYEQNLERAVASGKLTVADYHRQKFLLAETDLVGVDNGSTKTQGLIRQLETLFLNHARPGQVVHLCSPTDHYSASYGDQGWGCGYRNFQMLLSCLLRHPGFAAKLPFDGFSIPSIPKIQQIIEQAWKKGFDRDGYGQLKGQLVNTSQWIGATEIVAALSFLGIKCRLADFHAPSAPDGTHPQLLEWVRQYFCDSQQISGFLPPLYLQHQGHSRTIVGVELEGGTTKLLLFDPGVPRDQLATLEGRPLSWKQIRFFRRSQEGFKARQYQIVAVVGFLSAAEYEDSKILKSERVA